MMLTAPQSYMIRLYEVTSFCFGCTGLVSWSCNLFYFLSKSCHSFCNHCLSQFPPNQQSKAYLCVSPILCFQSDLFSLCFPGEVNHYCCFGFCIDLLRHLANRTGFEVSPTSFTYDLHLVGDGQVGEEIVENETRRWTGIVGEILAGTADLAVGPVSITPERAARVEFSKPFKYFGITILIKRVRRFGNGVSPANLDYKAEKFGIFLCSTAPFQSSS